MINDNSIEFNHLLGKGKALVWVIDGECLYDLPLNHHYADMFLSMTEAIDISDEYPDHDGITVRLMSNENHLEDFQTSEYFGSILLSNPLVLDLSKYAYGRYVESPHARFDGEKFIILSQDASNLMPFLPDRGNQ